MLSRCGNSSRRAAQLADNGETAAEQDHENRLDSHLLSAGEGYHTLALRDVGKPRTLKRLAHVSGGLSARLGAGESLAPVARAQQSVAPRSSGNRPAPVRSAYSDRRE